VSQGGGRISVIIVNIDQKDYLKKCLTSVFSRAGDDPPEVIVVDNGSTDGSREMLRRDFPGVRLVLTEGRRGFSENYNEGIRAARGDFLLILNNDAEILGWMGDREASSDQGFFDALARRLEADPRAACLGPMLLYPDGRIQVECARSLPTVRDILFGTLWLDQLFSKSRFFGRLNMTYWDHGDARYVDCISGACLLLRNSVMRELGGWDEDFFLMAEDADLCRRIRKAGFFILYDPDFRVRHHSGRSVGRAGVYAGRIEALLSLSRYFGKHHGAVRARLFRWTIVPVMLAKILFVENSLVAPLFRRPAAPWRERWAACLSLLEWKSQFTGRVPDGGRRR